MSDNSTETPLEIIEVPPELRGPSDEEILQMSEKKLREVSGKRKKGERRPSKKARMAMKQEKERLEAENLAKELFTSVNKSEKNSSSTERFASEEYGNLTYEKRELVRNAFTPRSPGFTSFMTSASLGSLAPKTYESRKVVESPPPSGRVLKVAFGKKTDDKPKATIVSAAELAKQKAEERAKKIREALLAKKAPQATESTTASEDAQPVKRPRGRPRKNPIV